MNGPSPIDKAEALLAEVEHSKSQKDRVAWAIIHQTQLAECVQDLIAHHAGYAAESNRLASLASKLLDAIAPLHTERPGGKDFIDQWIEGTAPKLRVAFAALKEYLEQ